MNEKICVQTLIGHTSTIKSLIELSPGVLASGSLDFTIRIWNFSSSELISTIYTNKLLSSMMKLSNGLIAVGFSGFIKLLRNNCHLYLLIYSNYILILF